MKFCDLRTAERGRQNSPLAQLNACCGAEMLAGQKVAHYRLDIFINI